jgi:hypothetical protein
VRFMRSSFAALPLLLLSASPALAQAPPGAACDFRAATIAALFAAAGDAGAATRLLAAGDAAAAQAPLAAIAARLRDARRQVGSDGRGLIEPRERKSLRRALGSAGRHAAKAAARAGRRPVDRVTVHAAAAADAIERLLAEQVETHATLDCAGGEIRVEELFVGAGETRRVPGGSAIVAERGVEILGDLVTTGGLTIEAETGDVVLEGRVDARGGQAIGTARAARGGAAQIQDCADAEDLTIRARRRDVRIGTRFVAASDGGRDCAPLHVTDRSQLEETIPNPSILRLGGHRGGEGGNIVVSAPSGAIRFATRPLDDPGVFWPGDGGAGQDVTIDSGFVPPAGFNSVRVLGGDGGSAGFLVLDARSADLLPLYRVLAGGDGGRGGSVDWDVRAGDALFPASVDVFAVGGTGGFGAVEGGRGGNAHYQGDRAVNAPGEPTTEVVAAGGSGGDVFQDLPRMPPDDARGGEGGSAEATGHRGADGTDVHPAGGTGGLAEADGGSGGRVPEDRALGVGGRGGDASGWGGRGGDGWPSCLAPPGSGGGGGAGGIAVVRAGDGGSGIGGRGGAGGNSLAAVAGKPGAGGEGQPAGTCGALASAQVSMPGAGGPGGTPGENGTAVAPETTACDADTFTCEEAGPPRDPCVSPRSYGAFVSDYQGLADGRTYTLRETTLSGFELCTGEGCNGALHTTSTVETRKYYDQPLYTIVYDPHQIEWGSLVFSPYRHLLWYDHCTRDGVLHRAGDSGVDATPSADGTWLYTITHSCLGACACGARAVACCPDRGGWVPDDDGVCRP